MLQWRPINQATINGILHHPVYAGAYVYGRRETNLRKAVPGEPSKGRRWAKPEDWDVLIQDKLPAYITWENWQKNQQKLRENSVQYGQGGAARGSGLLASRVRCGRCGYRMSISYADKQKARYTCDMHRNHCGAKQCQAFNAKPLHELVEKQLLIAISPASIQLSVDAIDLLRADRQQVAKHHQQTIQRATYEADLARRRYEEVDPANRLVASELERRWETALVAQRHAEEELARFEQTQPSSITPSELTEIQSLANDIPALWHAETTSGIDRQTIVRTLIDQVTAEVIGDTERLQVTIHWSGGFESRHEVVRSVGKFEQLESCDAIRTRIIQLKRRGHSYQGIADALNGYGYHAASGSEFTSAIVSQLCKRFRQRGETISAIVGYEDYWTPHALAGALSLSVSTLRNWQAYHWLAAIPSGKRWIIWADDKELNRLRKLADHQRSSECRNAPAKLTTPRSPQ
ncbi:MAG: recombinase family protein [Pirellulaceae bacterium]